MWPIESLKSQMKFPQADGGTSGLRITLLTASRGLLPSELMNHHLWLCGPPWISLDQAEWPQKNFVECEAVVEEVITRVSTPDERPECVVSPGKYSSYSKLIRVIAWIKRFVSKSIQVTASSSELLPESSVSSLTVQSYQEKFKILI